MNKLLGCLLLLAACKTPEARYVDAVNKKLAGDSRGYAREMTALAHDEPESRAGRRARMTVASGGLPTTLFVGGVIAAVAIPSFMKFQKRATQAEAGTVLRRLHLLLEARRAGYGRYGADKLGQVAETPLGRYFVFLQGDLPLAAPPGVDPWHAEELRLRLTEFSLQPFVTADDFLAVAVANLDDDPDLDVWTIDSGGTLVHVADDLQ